MLKMYKGTTVLHWPSFMQEDAESRGWELVPETAEDDQEVQMIAPDCPAGMVEIKLPTGTQEKPTCLKTPEWWGAERYFTKARMHTYYHDGENWIVQVHPEELKKRKLTFLIG